MGWLSFAAIHGLGVTLALPHLIIRGSPELAGLPDLHFGFDTI
jgi:hypothetical protein